MKTAAGAGHQLRIGRELLTDLRLRAGLGFRDAPSTAPLLAAMREATPPCQCLRTPTSRVSIASALASGPRPSAPLPFSLSFPRPPLYLSSFPLPSLPSSPPPPHPPSRPGLGHDERHRGRWGWPDWRAPSCSDTLRLEPRRLQRGPGLLEHPPEKGALRVAPDSSGKASMNFSGRSSMTSSHCGRICEEPFRLRLVNDAKKSSQDG